MFTSCSIVAAFVGFSLGALSMYLYLLRVESAHHIALGELHARISKLQELVRRADLVYNDLREHLNKHERPRKGGILNIIQRWGC